MNGQNRIMFRPFEQVVPKTPFRSGVPSYLSSLRPKDREMFQVSYTLLTSDQKEWLLKKSEEHAKMPSDEPLDLDDLLMKEFNFDMYNNELVYRGQIKERIISEGRAREQRVQELNDQIYSEVHQAGSWIAKLTEKPVVKILPDIDLKWCEPQLKLSNISETIEGTFPQVMENGRISELHPFNTNLRLVGGRSVVNRIVNLDPQILFQMGSGIGIEVVSYISSEIHPFQIDSCLKGGGRGKTTGHTIMDLTLGGKKRLKPKIRREETIPEINDCEICADLERVPIFEEKDLRLEDNGYARIVLHDESIPEVIVEEKFCEKKPQCSLMIVELSVDSYITEVLAIKNADASLLRKIFLPRLIHETAQNSVNRYIFRSKGQDLGKYFVAHVDVCSECTMEVCGRVGCDCVLKVQGVRNLFGFYSEMRLTDRASTHFFFLDIERKFVLRGSEVVPKGVRRGFNFDDSMCADFCRFEEKNYKSGSSLLTSIPYLSNLPSSGLDEKTNLSFSVKLPPGIYEVIAFPTRFKLDIRDYGAFSSLRRINGSAGGVVEVVLDKDTICKLSSHCGCDCEGGTVRDAFWAIVWCRIDGGKYGGEVKFISKFRFIDD